MQLPEEGILFAARDILPLNLLSTDRHATWIVCPLLRSESVIPGTWC